MFRAIRIRRVSRKVLENELVQAKRQLTDIWMERSVSLIYRTKYWLCFQDASYLNLALIKEEVDKSKRKKKDDKNAANFEMEKKTLYAKLKKEIPENIKNQLFEQFQIPVRSKKRKDHLVHALWNFKSTDFKDEKAEIKDEKQPKKQGVKITAFEAVVNKHAKAYDLVIEHGHLDSEIVADLTDRIQLKRERRIKSNLLTIVLPVLMNLGHEKKNEARLRASVSRGCEVIKLLQNEVRTESQEKAKLEMELQAVKLLLNGQINHSMNVNKKQLIQKEEKKNNKR